MDHSVRGYLERRTKKELEEILENRENYSEDIVNIVQQIKAELEKE